MAQVSAAESIVQQENILDVPGCVVTPGLVDMHVHVLGGGGEAGPASCTPPSQLSNFLDAGIFLPLPMSWPERSAMFDLSQGGR